MPLSKRKRHQICFEIKMRKLKLPKVDPLKKVV